MGAAAEAAAAHVRWVKMDGVDYPASLQYPPFTMRGNNRPEPDNEDGEEYYERLKDAAVQICIWLDCPHFIGWADGLFRPPPGGWWARDGDGIVDLWEDGHFPSLEVMEMPIYHSSQKRIFNCKCFAGRTRAGN